MEAIDLTLNQVNFEAEEHDISANQELHSFSNLVAFDSDIRGGDEDDKPVIARRFRKSKGNRNQLTLLVLKSEHSGYTWSIPWLLLNLLLVSLGDQQQWY